MSSAANHSFVMTNAVANRVLIPLLRSRWGHRLGRRLAVVEYVGRRSGLPHQLVTQYSLDGQTVYIRVGAADRKTWWRNFQSPARLRLRLGGEEDEFIARAVSTDEQTVVVAELDRRRSTALSGHTA